MRRKSGLAALLERLGGKKGQASQAVRARATPAAKETFPAKSGKSAPGGGGKGPAASAGKTPIPPAGQAPRGTAGEGKAPGSGPLPRGTAERASGTFQGAMPQSAQGRGEKGRWRAAVEANRRILTPLWRELLEEGRQDGSIQTEYTRELSELLRVQRRLRPSAGEYGEEVV